MFSPAGLSDPLQLYSLFEVIDSEGAGEDAVLRCKCVDKSYDRPINFLADFSHVSGHGEANDAPSMLCGKKPHSSGCALPHAHTIRTPLCSTAFRFRPPCFTAAGGTPVH